MIAFLQAMIKRLVAERKREADVEENTGHGNTNSTDKLFIEMEKRKKQKLQ